MNGRPVRCLICTIRRGPAETRNATRNPSSARQRGEARRCHLRARSSASMAARPEEIHLQDLAAPTGADHSRLFAISIFLHHVERPPPERLGKRFLDHKRSIRRNEPAVDAQPSPMGEFPDITKKPSNPGHAVRLSAGSIRPRRGVVSPVPTRPPRISQIPSSGSVMISMLARLKITLP